MRVRAIERHGLKLRRGSVMALFAISLMMVVSGCFEGHHEQRGASLLDDKVTTARVESALHGGVTNQFAEVHATTTNGVVTLSGLVGSAEQKEKAEKLAAGVHRVRSLKNEIAVKSQ